MKKDNKTRIFCNYCKRLTNHDIIAHESKSFTPDNTPGMEISFAEGTWEIIKCCGCEEVTFRETWINSEDVDMRTGQPEEIIRVYPPRNENKLQIKPYSTVPLNIQLTYREVIDCYNNEIYTLCAAGLRALIEGICVANNIKAGPIEVSDKSGKKKIIRKSNIQGRIEGMVEAGLLTKKHADSLHEHRFLGNKAMHELERPNKEKLKLAIEIIEHTLENLYEIPNKAKYIKLFR